ncbi:MAG: adenine phosphoribosyltransferase [Elusimicrobiota bacterium]
MGSPADTTDLKSLIRDVPDFPKKGIVFKDITPLLADKDAFKAAVDRIVARYAGRGIEQVAAVESRGFLFASTIAYRLGAGVIPIRKKGKLPYKTISAAYELEYGTDSLEIHEDAVRAGTPVLLVDDLLATGGTAKASCELLEKLGAKVEGVCFLIELAFLKGREKLPGRDVFCLMAF